jgi:NAD(P) transhydrogenase subunit alpha
VPRGDNALDGRQRRIAPLAPAQQQRGSRVDFISILSIFVLACFVGYYVVWSVTPALHTPLMAVTNAISSVIIVGALVASAAAGSDSSKWLGLLGVVLASINIFGGFAVTARMLAMYKKKDRPAPAPAKEGK